MNMYTDYSLLNSAAADVQEKSETVAEAIKITLTFRKFVFDPHKRMMQ